MPGRDGVAAIVALLERHGWVAALIVCIPALAPTLLPGWYEGHDDLHILRLIQYDVALRDGQIPPRWFPDVSAGLGNPHPVYYAPLFYYTALALHALGAGVILSLKGALVLFTALAAVGMYRYARLHFEPAASLVAAAAYTYAPYHLLDIHVRKAFSEYTVFAVLPFLLEAFHRLRFRGSRWDIIAGAVWLAALSTAHTISTMLAPPLLGAYALVLARLPDAPAAGGARRGAAPRWAWRWLARAAVSVALGYMLAGFFLVPAFLERGAINLRMYTEAYVDYHQHFVYPQQLAWWPWGFGMSRAGLKDTMSFRMGLLQIAGMIMALIGWRRLQGASARSHVVFFLAVSAVAIFMMLPVSVVVWDLLPSLKFVQFPWRFLTLTTIASGILCAAAFAAWMQAPRRARGATGRAWALAGGVAALMAVGAIVGGTLGVNLRIPADRIGYEEKPFPNLIDRGAGAPPLPLDAALVRNHTLHWIDHLPPDVSYMGLTPADAQRPRAEVVSGPARISALTGSSWRHRFRVDADGPARLRVNIYRLPGWKVLVDGAEAEMLDAPARERPLLFFDVPAGSHQVEAVLASTGSRRLGDLLTLSGLAGLALAALWPQRPAPDAA